MSQVDINTEEWHLADHLVTRVRDHATGSSASECVRNFPRDVYFIGNLRPRQDHADQPADGFDELLTKLAPVAFGAEFSVEPIQPSAKIKVVLSWSCYYRIFPSLAQQREHQRVTVAAPPPATPSQQDNSDADVDSVSDTSTPSTPTVANSPSDRRQTRRPADSLFIRFKKLSCRASGIVNVIGTGSQMTADPSDLEDAIAAEILRATNVAQADVERARSLSTPTDRIQVSESDLTSESAYQAFLASLKCAITPQWKWDIAMSIRDDLAGGHILESQFTNASARQVGPNGKDNPNIEAFLFDTAAEFEFLGLQVNPFTLELAPRGFRYDRQLWGRGFNCAVNMSGSAATRFSTTHVPVSRQMRFATSVQPSAAFADLEQNPVSTLTAIGRAMQDYRIVWQTARERYRTANSHWEAEHGTAFDRDSAQFIEEIARFEQGLALISNDADVDLAFRLTNATFRRAGAHSDPTKAKTHWRLFQIVFLLTQISGISALKNRNDQVALNDRNMVDIVYFPTGGGKTEAYLACLVYHCFLDRLRGKNAGVTAWTRFPLRLLTLQQTQRMADIIGAADLVRRAHSDTRLSGSQASEFAVGYFVGAEATPNELVNPQQYQYAKDVDSVNWSIANDPAQRQRWRRLTTCPGCRTKTVSVEFDAANIRLSHKCSNVRCGFPGGIIPVYVVDNEIYRYLPTIIVGTIDKLAGIGNQRKLSMVFGRVDGRCSTHGFFKGKCCQKDCANKSLLNREIPQGLTGPTMFVQDELHLLKEGLGTFDSHYESFTQRLLKEFGQQEAVKIIASSATIEAFERQVEHLYGRAIQHARVFPSQGPVLGASFYAQTLSHPQRLFVGILPHNKTIFNAILELIELYHRELQELYRLAPGSPSPYSGSVLPGTPAWHRLLDFYETSLTYFLAGRELNSIRTDIEGDVNPHLARDNFQPVDIHELTGNTSTDDVTRVLERLEVPASPNVNDAILATSMVSHGVDVDRLNAMIFYGMPRQNAEYIQASSRVGRSHVGIVFDCLHPARERDQSHYSYFTKFHEYLGQMVEPVAINRWAKFSINRTLPGLFMGVLLQILATREPTPDQFYRIDFVRKKITDGSITANQFIDFLEEAYNVRGVSTPAALGFRSEIRLRVQQYLDYIVGGSGGNGFVSDVLIPRPMRSLRDVDEAIEIELDTSGSQWAALGI